MSEVKWRFKFKFKESNGTDSTYKVQHVKNVKIAIARMKVRMRVRTRERTTPKKARECGYVNTIMIAIMSKNEHKNEGT